MHYAIRYVNGTQFLEEADEIIVEYKEKSAGLIKFVQEHEGKRVIADATGLSSAQASLKILQAASAASSLFTVLLSVNQKEAIKLMQNEKIKFFIKEYADSWDMLHSLVLIGVTDVYIANDFAFSMQDIATYCHSNNVAIRVYPNVAQTNAYFKDKLPTFKFFFIRPEDLRFYEGLVDTIEFYCSDENQNILYKIYKDGKWRGDLSILILGLDENANGNMIAPGFAQGRLNCGKRCSYTGCRRCDSILALADKMSENGYKFGEEREEENNEFKNVQNDLQNDSRRATSYFGGVLEEEI